MVNKLYLQNDALDAALRTTVFKNDVIQDNIANVDTPGYKRKSMAFDGIFADALYDARRGGDLSATALTPRERVYDTGSWRLDANNVNIDYEMAAMYENAIKYETLASSVINNYKRLHLVVNGA
ncbi:MAG: flagellar basal body rod protein FlgB [Clostridiales bacterium]|nr:flagellar basal body rod protein FlgB [Clostridiales bacterium]